MLTIEQAIGARAYPGRGILLGKSSDGGHAVFAYFIMGRSENSRNRVFVADGDALRTQAHDPAKLIDPSLVIYAPVRVLGPRTIVTNGDQTDTILAALSAGETFEAALRTRTYEPDAPFYTPRISGMATFEGGGFSYTLALLKHGPGAQENCLRFFYEYASPVTGISHFLHTYEDDGDPPPAFEGEPRAVSLEGTIGEVTDALWQNLNENNRVALFVRFVRLEDGKTETKIINKHA